MDNIHINIKETIEHLHLSLRDYIEATYHISHPLLITQRRELLDETGVIHQKPYIETTPRYKTGRKFEDLGLSQPQMEIFSTVTKESDNLPLLIHDPPYEHQAEAITQSLIEEKSVVVKFGAPSKQPEIIEDEFLGILYKRIQRDPEMIDMYNFLIRQCS